jgi:GntR family transcriptional regulator
LLRQIEAGVFSPRARLPSENDLVQLYGVSRITVRQALSELVHEGVLIRVQGKGTFLSPMVLQRRGAHFSFSEEMKRKGVNVHSRTLSVEVLHNPIISKELLLDYKDQVIRLVRCRLDGDEPLAIQTTYLPHGRLDPDLLWNVSSLYRLFAEQGIVPSRARESYQIEPILSQAVADHLQLDFGTPTFFSRRHTYGADSHVIDFTESWLRWDRYNIEVEIQR